MPGTKPLEADHVKQMSGSIMPYKYTHEHLPTWQYHKMKLYTGPIHMLVNHFSYSFVISYTDTGLIITATLNQQHKSDGLAWNALLFSTGACREPHAKLKEDPMLT